MIANPSNLGNFVIADIHELCDVADAHGTGYDTSYDGRSDDPRITFIRGHLDPTGPRRHYDFVVSRHVLEHLADPYGFLVDLRHTLNDTRPVHGYIEVPDARYDIAGAGWDCIYPHVGYFTSHSLHWLLTRAGFAVAATGTAFNGQFLYAEISTHRTPSHDEGTPPPAGLLTALTTFANRRAAAITQWRQAIADIVGDGGKPVLWGAGARGVSFLNAVDPHHRFTAAVDRNPAKHWRYLPTGHRVLPPAALTDLKTTHVVLTNPNYQYEITHELRELGLTPIIITA